MSYEKMQELDFYSIKKYPPDVCPRRIRVSMAHNIKQ